MSDTRVSIPEIKDFVQSAFLALGFSKAKALLATENLLIADLRGIESHGVARLSGYKRLVEVGRINPNANPKIIHETPSTAVIDADAGLGLIVGTYAMGIAIEKANQVGTGWVSVSNSSHFGIAGRHAMQGLEQDMIGIAMTNASALVAPTFGKQRMLGTNPIAVAIPAGKEPAFVADFATTTAANGKLEILQRKNAATPSGWVQANDGTETNNANALKEGGVLLPLGSDYTHGSHKGYGLGSIVDIFSAVFSGANYGPWVPPFPAYVPIPENPVGKGIGHFFGAMRIDAWQPADQFKAHMDNWIQAFRNSEPIDPKQPVLVHGDLERLAEADRQLNGVPIHESVVKDLITIGKELGIDTQFLRQ